MERRPDPDSEADMFGARFQKAAFVSSFAAVLHGLDGRAQGQQVLPPPKVLPTVATPAAVAPFASPDVLADQKPLPINLATALRLANAQAWDIAIAAERIRIASAQLQQANVLWLPTIAAGVDYQHHDGRVQNSDGSLANTTRSSLEVGGAPEAAFSFTEAIFEPLAARQTLRAQQAGLQAATNDTTTDVAQAYFNVLEARGDLAGNVDTIQRTREMVRRIESMAPDLVPTVEVSRARAQLSRFDQTQQSARERWEVASAELARILRLDPAAVLVPAEPPHLQVTLVSPEQTLEALLPIAVMSRPELAAYRSLNEAALRRWQEEKYRPLLPVIYARGNSNQLPDSMAFGAYGGGSGGKLDNFGIRSDWEVQAMWELKNLGFGNAASIRRRRAEYDVSQMEASRLQDFVAREVAQAFARVRSARSRVAMAEAELREAIVSANQNFESLGQVKRVGGNIIIPIIRPQEAIASVQALLQAYFDYYGTVADYNRSQFLLYRALGNPGQALALPDGLNPNCAPGATANAPAAPQTPSK